MSIGTSLRPQPENGSFGQLPIELVHKIWMDLIEMEGNLGPVSIIARVSRGWHRLVNHQLMWAKIARWTFVAYPLLARLDSTPIDAEERAIVERISGAPSLLNEKIPVDNIVPPDREAVRRGLLEIKNYERSRRYQELVQRRRSFVLHIFLSLALLCFSLFLATTMCAAEHLDPITVCNSEVAFSFLWTAYVAIFGIVVANCVMAAHFEPRPLVSRLRRHTDLIKTSSATLFLCILFVALPTYLVQMNVRSKSLPWIYCAAPVLIMLAGWQVEVLYNTTPDLRQFFVTGSRLGLHALYTFLVHTTPTMFICAVLGIVEYLESGTWVSLLVGVAPVGLSFFVLSIVFLVDFVMRHQVSDLTAASCLAVANLFPVGITLFEFRGYLLLPLVVASCGFFLGHFVDLKRHLDVALFDPDGERVLFLNEDDE